ncbi:glycosyl hydrolase 2 galactose-binding domain-containing protein [Vibrio sp. WXL210]|uniref:glycosyl hydrolase 2 galactose-binding domain-containing protein n=1 Tax=Vibrio sp. WXL210 TaxID=3450709 RepID=UPI003EC6EDEC
MKLSIAGLWQVSPLTDLTIPQDDICFPAKLSQVLPSTLTEEVISQQEWHLMHDIELDRELSSPAIDLVLDKVSHYAEVRVNGVAVYDCHGDEQEYRKDIRSYLQPGRNRFEILFLAHDEDWLLEEEQQNSHHVGGSIQPIGIHSEPYLHCMTNVRLNQVEVEQVWHHGGGCEVLVHLDYQALQFGLVSVGVQFNGVTLQLPVDMRASRLTALFQVEAPRVTCPKEPQKHPLCVYIEEHCYTFSVALAPDQAPRRFNLST